MENKSEMQQLMSVQDILDMLKAADTEQNSSYKDSLAKTKMRLNDLEETVKTYNKLQQAKSVQTKLEKSMRQSMSEANVTTKPDNKCGHELQTELSKLNYLLH